MTIAAGFRCFDGVLLATDSQHSLGQSKFPGQKIWTIQCGDFVSGLKPNRSLLVIAGAGEDAFIINVVNSLKQCKELQRNMVSYEDVEHAIKDVSSGMKNSGLLVGVRIRTEREVRLLRVERAEGKPTITLIAPSTWTSATFFGAEVAESICREMAELMWHSGLSVVATQVIAKEMLKRVTEYARYCSPPIQTECLFDSYDPQSQPSRRPAKPLPEDFFRNTQYHAGRAIQNAVDFTVPDDLFEESLAALVEKLRKLREHSVSP
ncbi:MAG: hypothetical protein ABSF45_10050 [Terriglobia bacterium]|jgi:hypothetical protein